MERNITEQLIKSAENIKTKIRPMLDEENQTDLTMNKILKPVSDPLNVLVKSNYPCDSKSRRNIYNENDNTCSSSSNTFKGNASTSTLYEDFDNSTVSDKDEDMKSSDNDDYDKIPSKVKSMLETSSKKEDIAEIYDSINVPSGVRKENNKLLMGNSSVILSAMEDPLNKSKKYLISVDDKQYELTPGFKELLFRNKPDLALVSCEDQLAYRDMLHHTSAHKKKLQS